MILFPALLLVYLITSVPFGFLVAQWVKGVDIRRLGSGNTGATNVFRVVGKKWGILVLFLDALKGYLALWLALTLTHEDRSASLAFAFAVIAILGHSFPVWLRFKGGKGVATSLGVFLFLAPIPTWSAFALWILVFSLSRIISVASLSAALAFPVMVFVFEKGHSLLFPISLVLTVFIFYTHRANIERLLKKEEKRLI